MTDDEIASQRILDAAIRAARAAPKKQGAYVHAAQVPWTIIHELRAALDAMGIEWR